MSDNPLLDSHLRDRDRANADALRLLSLSDDFTVRYRLGLATFNAASIVALLTAIGAAPDALQRLGLDWDSLRVSMGFFVVGVVAAGVSIASTQNSLWERAGHAAARASNIEKLILIVSTPRHPNSGDKYDEANIEGQELFKKALTSRPLANWAQHFSSAAWLGGVSIPIIRLLFSS